jgi:hypothetical protein
VRESRKRVEGFVIGMSGGQGKDFFLCQESADDDDEWGITILTRDQRRKTRVIFPWPT